MRENVVSSIRPSFPGLSQSQGQVTHVLLTRSPLIHPVQAPSFSVRLACVKHAASVRPEPGSNSPSKNIQQKPPHHHTKQRSRTRAGSQLTPNTPRKRENTQGTVRPSTKNKKLWYQQTRHTIELTNNKPHHTAPHQGHNGRLRSASLAVGDPGCNSR